MNKKELVIITVVVNVAILALLFLTAHHIDEPVDSIAETQTSNNNFVNATTAPAILPVPAAVVKEDLSLDEVDNVLRDFAANYSTPRETPPAPYVPIVAAAPAAKAPANILVAPEPVHNEVVVKRGDFLEKIARNNGTSVDAIKKLNNLSSDNLRVGQILRMPAPTARKQQNIVAQTAPEQARGGEFYKLKSGDNPWKIAKQFGVSVEELLNLNNLDESSARSLKPGDTIRVR